VNILTLKLQNGWTLDPELEDPRLHFQGSGRYSYLWAGGRICLGTSDGYKLKHFLIRCLERMTGKRVILK